MIVVVVVFWNTQFILTRKVEYIFDIMTEVNDIENEESKKRHTVRTETSQETIAF